MAVTLSSLAGAGAQFFDNNGVPLAGGLIYTYLAGTTTPEATYTSSTGLIAHSNPIVLDAAGRIATGEVWLTSGVDYKFLVKTFANVQLGSYDNIPSINDFTSIYAALANTSNVALGDALVGFRQSNSSGALGGAVGRTVHQKLQETVSVKDFGAVGNGTTDDSAAFNLAIATGNPVYVPSGTYKTDNAVTTPRRLYTEGASFTGTNTIDPYPAFGQGVFKAYSTGSNNCIIGIADNNLAANTFSFPTGITGYGRNLSQGNAVFGLYAEARQYATTGVVSNEVDSFNHGSAPSNALPPNRGIGTPEQQPIALTVAAGGDFNSSIGIHIAREGSLPQKFLTGIYTSSDACVDFGLFIDATSSVGPTTGIVVKNTGAGINLRMITIGTAVPNNAVMVINDNLDQVKFGIKQSGGLVFNSDVLQTTNSGGGTATALPANPVGYLKFESSEGIFAVIPYYLA